MGQSLAQKAAYAAKMDRIREVYEAAGGGPVYLRELAKELCISVSAVCRTAHKMGLTNTCRSNPPRPRKRQPKYSTDEERRLAQSQRSKERWADPEYVEKQKATFTPERCLAISEARKKSIKENGHPRGAAGIKHGPETKAKISEKSKQGWKDRSQAKKDEMAQKRVATCLEKYGSGSGTRSNAEKPYSRCRGGKRSDLGHRYFRSSWEANYCRYLEHQRQVGEIQGWRYEETTFRFEGVKRGPFTYTPDFEVIDNDGISTFHEVKGWMDGKSRNRLKRMQKHYPDVAIKVIGEKEYKVLEVFYSSLPGWEPKR